MATTCSISSAVTKIANWFKTHVILAKKIPSAPKIEVFEDLDPDAITIFIKTLTGSTSMLKIHPSDLVEDLKLKIYQQLKVPIDSQRLIFQHSQLENGNTLESYRIRKDSTIHLAVRLMAGVQVSVQTKEGKTIPLKQEKKPNYMTDLLQSFSLPTFKEVKMEEIKPETKKIMPMISLETNYMEDQHLQFSKKNKRGTYTKKACSNCRNAHTACDSGRPCRRCLQLGLKDCCDAQRKKSKKRGFEDLDEKKTFENMQDLFPLLGNLEPKKETKLEQPTMEFEDLFSDLLDLPKEKLIELEFPSKPEDTEQKELKFDQEELLNPSLVDVNELSETETTLFPDENNLLQNMENQTDVMKNIIMSHIQQEQELKTLRNLVTNLQNYIFTTTLQNVALEKTMTPFVNKN